MDKIGILRCGVEQLLSIKVPFIYIKNKIESNTKQKSLRELGSNPRPQNSSRRAYPLRHITR